MLRVFVVTSQKAEVNLSVCHSRARHGNSVFQALFGFWHSSAGW